jgi:hypothetical protein
MSAFRVGDVIWLVAGIELSNAAHDSCELFLFKFDSSGGNIGGIGTFSLAFDIKCIAFCQ